MRFNIVRRHGASGIELAYDFLIQETLPRIAAHRAQRAETGGDGIIGGSADQRDRV